MAIESEELIQMYRTMLTIRRFEERVAKEFHEKAFPGVVHSYIGQEAIAVGVCAHLGKEDRIVSNHRGHGHCIAKGADIRRMMAEIYGRKTGYCKGKGGSMHIADFSVGILGANGIVAAGLPIATGAAVAAQLERKNRVAVVFFGDGACQEGEFQECMNLASIWKLPMIFVCENNQYGVNTPVQYAIAGGDLLKRAAAYDMPVIAVDGNDVIAVYEIFGELAAGARAGEGPRFLECKTYRWRAHFEITMIPDLRPVDEIESWKKKCPVARLERMLLKDGILTGKDIEAMDSQIMAQIEDAVTYALESPLPAPEDALENIYSV